MVAMSEACPTAHRKFHQRAQQAPTNCGCDLRTMISFVNVRYTEFKQYCCKWSFLLGIAWLTDLNSLLSTFPVNKKTDTNINA